MGLLKEGYKLILVLLFIILNTSLFSQYQCSILAPEEPEKVTATRVAGQVSQNPNTLGHVEWQNLENHRVSDDEHVSIVLGAADRSYQLRFSDFGFSVPAGATIEGISLMVEGHSRGSGKLKDMQVQLLSGEPVGEDKSNIPLKGTHWVQGTEDGSWQYGVNVSLWDFDWSSSDINASNFGFVIQLENEGWGDHSAYIDQVKLIVHYTPIYDLCLHDCSVFFVEPIDGVENYTWDIPSEFEFIDSEVNQHIANLNFIDSTQGNYTICVTPQGHPTCCRDFVFNDCAKGSLGDYVWMDNNANGLQDNDESGIEGSSVFLFSESGQHIATQITDENGFYLFDTLCTGNYQVQVSPTDPKYVPTINNGGNSETDSNFDPAFGPFSSSVIHLEPGEHIRDVDFGFVPPSKISGIVWKDANGLGDLEGDLGLGDIPVTLMDCDGNIKETVITNSQGEFLFDCVYMGSYALHVPAQEDFMAVSIGESQFTDDFGLHTTSCFELPMNTTVEVNLAFKPLLDLGNYVWEDINQNGLQDANENGIQGISLDLYDSSSNLLSSTTTDESGFYLFTDLMPGIYTVQISSFEDWVLTNKNEGAEDNDSDGMLVDNSIVSDPIDLTQCLDNLDTDFGFFPAFGCVEGIVWKDANGDAINNDGIFAESIDITLFGCDSTLFITTRTDAQGFYEICDVPMGSYFIEFGSPPACTYSIGGDSDVDNLNGAGNTACFDIEAMQTEIKNAGKIVLLDIGDFVWEDTNKNGIQDAGEPGIANIAVELFDNSNTLVASTQTDENGLYQFTNQWPGTYTIRLSNTGTYLPSPITESTDSSDGSNAIGQNGEIRSNSFSLLDCEDDFTIDFGLCQPTGCIAGNVWKDANGNAINDNESGFPNVPITLFSCTGSEVQSTTSEPDGSYEFCNLIEGSYYVVFLETQEYTYATTGESDVTNSTQAGSTDCANVIGDETTILNAGLWTYMDVGDLVWQDTDKNGIQNEDEFGLGNVWLHLLDENGIVIDSSFTTTDGEYLFENVLPGTYSIIITNPGEFIPTTNNVGTPDLDSNAIYVDETISSGSFTLFECTDNLDIDFGLCFPIIPTGCIEGIVWKDANGNAINDNESGFADVPITIFSCTGSEIQSTTSGADGSYQFCDLVEGSYYVEFWETPEYTYATSGESDVTNSIQAGSTDCVNVIGDETTTLNAGLWTFMNVGDLVWQDANKNGIQDPGEFGLGNVWLHLLDENGIVIDSSFTTTDGDYLFENVLPGTYSIIITNPGDFVPTANNVGTPDLDSNAIYVGETISSGSFTLFECTDNLDIDFGLCFPINPVGCITGLVWKDLNEDGLFINETGQPNITVELYTCTGDFVQNTITDFLGLYELCDIPIGDYYVRFIETDVFTYLPGSNSSITDSFDSGTSSCTTLVAQDTLELNAAARGRMDIGDFVWLDANKNGVQDSGEQGIAEINLSLIDASGALITSTSTDINGQYLFQDIAPSNYYILISNADGFDPAVQNAGNQATDSNGILSGEMIISETFSLLECETRLDIDFGLCIPEITLGCVQGNVWKDANGDAINSGELPFANSEISLYTCDGDVVSTIFSDENGNYEFCDVEPGSYYVEFWETEEYIYLTGNESDVTHNNGRGSTDCFNSNGETLTFDAALVPLLTVGDRVWNDANKNGIQDDGETGVAGIFVSIYNVNGTFINSVVTNDDGFYSIPNTIPGEYFLQIDFFEGFDLSIADITSDELDSDGFVNGQNIITNSFTLYECIDNLDLDFGLSTIEEEEEEEDDDDEREDCMSGLVWSDNNANGINDNEEGVEGVFAYLSDCDGNVIDTTVTDADGTYSFCPMPEGSFYIRFDCHQQFSYILENDSDVTNNFGIGTTDCFDTTGSEEYVINAGLGPISTAGDFVWNDINKNGQQDADEPGISGIVVELYTEAGQFVSSVATNANGRYWIGNIPPGNYFAQISSFDGWTSTPNAQGDSTLDSNGMLEDGVIKSEILTLNDGGFHNSIDFGLCEVEDLGTEIAGRLWRDADGDLFIGDEVGMNEISISLFTCDGTLVQDILTNENGSFNFSDLEVGSYYIGVNPLEDYNIGVGGNSEFQEDWRTSCFDVNDNSITTINLGILPLSKIGDTVWNDTNGDGIYQPATEVGLSGFTMNLYNEDQELVDTDTTDDSGKYQFPEVEPGIYTMEAIPPGEGFELTLNDIGDDDRFDSDGSLTDGRFMASNVTAFNGVDVFFYDFGFILEVIEIIPTGLIGNRIWDDVNRNGIADQGEPGIAGVEIELYDDEGNLLDTKNSNQNGFYFFGNLANGDYTLRVAIPAGFELTDALIGDAENDSNGILEGDRAVVTAVVSEPNNQDDTYDIGFRIIEEAVIGSLTGIYWRDMDDDGLNNDGLFLTNTEVMLFTCEGELVATTRTNGQGAFEFEDVAEGEYYIEFTPIDNSVFQTVGGSTIETENEGITECFIYDGQTNVVMNGAIIPFARLGDFVWEDINENGVQDEGEPGIPDIAIELSRVGGSPIDTMVTNSNGGYLVTNVRPGTYELKILTGENYELTEFKNNDNDQLDSDATMVNGEFIIQDVIVAGVNNFRYDFGLINLEEEEEEEETNNNSLMGFVFEDRDGNGILGEVDDVQANIEVRLIDSNGSSIQTIETDDNGLYEFTGIPDGVYQVRFILGNQAFPTRLNEGNNENLDSDLELQDGLFMAGPYDLTTTSSTVGVNAGFFFGVTIGDYIWNDENSNGIQDGNESGANDVLIRLFDENGNQVSFTTSESNPENGEAGYFLFQNISPGNYYLNSSLSFGSQFSDPLAGNDEELDSNVDNSNGSGTTSTFALQSGESDLSIDIGLLSSPGLIGDRVWIDENGDGIFDEREIGINGVDVTLFHEDGTEVTTQITSDDEFGEPGYFAFEEIDPGNYYLVFGLPNGYLPTIPFQGGNASFDSDVTGIISEGSTNIFSVSSGLFINDIDCGVFLPAAIGDYVWRDNNNNGIQQFGEFGVANVDVNLIRENEGVIKSTTTSAQGNYMFDDLRPGTYFVQFEMPNNLMFTARTQGPDDTKDSNVDMTGLSEAIVVEQSETILHVDAGLINATAMVSGRTWADLDGNGLQDFEEPDMDNITISLIDSDGNSINETSTNILGRYTFPFVEPGEYQIQFSLPDDFAFTTQQMFNNPSVDSDPDETGLTSVFTVEVDDQVEFIDAGYVERNLIIELDAESGISLFGEFGDNEIALGWTDEAFESGNEYMVWKSHEGSVPKIVGIVMADSADDMYFDDFDNKMGGQYDFQIEKVMSSQASIYSNRWLHMKESTIYDVHIYPMPAQDYVTINFKKEKESDVIFSIVDLNGSKVKEYTYRNMQAGHHVIELPLYDMKIGKYILQTHLGKVMHSEILIKID